jgi:hypothetical protein
MNRRTIISLRTYAEIERERERRGFVARLAWYGITAAAAYFAAHIFAAYILGK